MQDFDALHALPPPASITASRASSAPENASRNKVEMLQFYHYPAAPYLTYFWTGGNSAKVPKFNTKARGILAIWGVTFSLSLPRYDF